MSENKTFSAAPFVSRDGVDENGVRAEVRVFTGYGDVKNIEKSKNGAAYNVFFEVSNNPNAVKGWAPIDSNVMKKVKEAQDKNEPIHFRIEQRRKDHVDRTIPISELLPREDMAAARENAFRSLVAVRFDDENDWTISPHALTRLDEDPRAGGMHSAYDMTPEEIQASKAIPAAASSNNGNSGGYSGFEPAPWVLHRATGEINPGSVAVSVPLTIYSFVAEKDRKGELALNDKQKLAITKYLIATANKLQLSIYDGELETPDLSAGSHTRARALVFSTIEDFFPLSAEVASTPDSLKEWVKAIHDKALAMWKWSISEIDKIS